MNSEPAIQIESVQGPAFVQDGGRRGSMLDAVPPGGALVPELLAVTQRALGHPWNEAALEIYGGLAIRALRDVRVSLDGVVHRLAANEVFRVQPSQRARCRYLAIEGGVDVPVVLGGRGTLVSLGLGGFEGRALKRGDVLRTADSTTLRPSTSPRPFDNAALASSSSSLRGASFLAAAGSGRTDEFLAVAGSGRGDRAPDALDAWLLDPSPIRIVAGPDLDRFTPAARDTLTRTAFTIAPESDRVGARLDGLALARVDSDDGGSRPMVRGAIEVPSHGRPIVLGPDHPTTGGYPVIAVVIRADQGRFRARVGAEIRFVEVTVEQARAAWVDHAARWFSDDP